MTCVAVSPAPFSTPSATPLGAGNGIGWSSRVELSRRQSGRSGKVTPGARLVDRLQFVGTLEEWNAPARAAYSSRFDRRPSFARQVESEARGVTGNLHCHRTAAQRSAAASGTTTITANPACCCCLLTTDDDEDDGGGGGGVEQHHLVRHFHMSSKQGSVSELAELSLTHCSH